MGAVAAAVLTPWGPYAVPPECVTNVIVWLMDGRRKLARIALQQVGLIKISEDSWRYELTLEPWVVDRQPLGTEVTHVLASFDITLPNGRVFETRNRLKPLQPTAVLAGDTFKTTYSIDAHNIGGTVVPEGWLEKKK
jgi:hypothetical protein